MQLTEDVLAEYELIGPLGRGGQGVAYRGRHRSSGTQVVLKVLDFLELSSWKDFELWQREGKILRSLRHPAIPGFFGHFPETASGDAPEAVVTVQEFVDGTTLEALLEQAEGPLLAEEEAREFLAEMLDVLSYLHSLNPPVVHRDIKPSNIVRRPDGMHVLIDFGAARSSSALTAGSTFVGTNGYMPPEQLMGRAEPRSDLFALADDDTSEPHRGASMTQYFGRYTEERVLSRRSTTATLLCRDETGAPRVLKLFYEPGPATRDKLRDRADALHQLDHPGLARYVGLEEDEQHVAIVYEWVPGDTVAALIERGQRFTTDELWDCLREVTEAITTAHHAERPVVHRDIKPHNMVFTEGRYVLIDFDAAREVLDTSHNASVVGTTGYAAPEQFIGRAVPASDQYGLAATVLHMATHRHHGEFELKQLRIDLSVTEIAAPLKRILTRMLEPQPESRFPSGEAVLGAIDSGSGAAPWETALVPIERLDGSIVKTTRTPGELGIEIGSRWRPASVLIAGLGSVVIAAMTLVAVLAYDVRFTLAFLGLAVLATGLPHARMEWRRRAPSIVRLTDEEWVIESGKRSLTGTIDRPPEISAARLASLDSAAFMESRAGLTATSDGQSIDFGLGMLPAEADAVRSAIEAALAPDHETAITSTESTALVRAPQLFEQLDRPVRNPFRLLYGVLQSTRPMDSTPQLPPDFQTRLEREGFRPLGGVQTSLLGVVVRQKFAVYVNDDGTMVVEAKLGGSARRSSA